MADYPNSIFKLRDLENIPGQTYDPEKKTTVFAEDLQNIANDLIAVQETLGTNPEGTKPTVKERLPLFGTGFPNGAVSAPVGTIYIDTAVTNGASSWIKKSGTGNTGWVVLEGDTGWRNVSDWFDNTNVITESSTLFWRRTGDTVNIRGSIVTTAPNTTTPRTTMRALFTFISDNSVSPSRWDVQRMAFIETSIGRIAPRSSVREYGAQTLVSAGNWGEDSIVFNEFLPIESIALWPTTLPGTSA